MNWKTAAFLGVFALVFIDFLFFNIPIGPLRMTLLRVVLIALFFILAIRVFLKKDPFRLTGIKYPLSVLGIWFYYGLFSLAWAANKVTGIKELYYFAIFILLIMVLIYLLQAIHHSWITFSFWASSWVMIAISFIELVFNRHFPISRFVIEAETFEELNIRRATTFFYNENDFSVYLVFAVPFFLIGLLGRSTFLKFLNVAAICSILVINYVNDARISVGAILIQIAIFIFLTRKKFFSKAVNLALIFSPLLIAGLGAVMYLLQDADIFGGLREGRGSAFIRMNLYLNGLYATFRSFMLGVGPGNFRHHIYPMFNTLGKQDPHNWWLEVLSNYGLLIFALYLTFFIYIIYRLYVIFRTDREKNLVALALFLGWAGFIPASIGPSSLFYFWPMWMMYGVSLGYISKMKGKYRNQLESSG